MERCIACGLCAKKCPRKVKDEFNAGLSKRKAIYVRYEQAVPLKYAIDKDHCIYFQKGKCRACEKVCPAKAIEFQQKEREFNLKVGSIVLALGFEPYDPSRYDTYGYQSHANILTSLEFERMLSASGPYRGHVVRPSDGGNVQKIAWLQCVGSRDLHSGAGPYCSAVCCTYAIKEAVVAKEHIRGLDTAIFYIDIRTHGKDFERYYERAREEYGVRFVKSRISSVEPGEDGHTLRLSYVDPSGHKREEEFDLVVLSVGLECSPRTVEFASRLDLKTDSSGFPVTSSFKPVNSSRPGIYVCGAFQSPKDIPQSVMEASAAAAAASLPVVRDLEANAPVDGELAMRRTVGEPPRIGVFVCHCGINIAGVVDVQAVRDYAKGLPYVEYVEDNMYACSQDSQDKIAQIIREKNLNRIVVAACTPKTHEPLFQETLANAGLNKYLFEMANIRNQDSWVHADQPELATEKAKVLVRMAVAKAALLEELEEIELKVNQKALVVGGGVAGMVAAKTLAEKGYHTYLVERAIQLGGHARSLYETWRGESVQAYLEELIEEVNSSDNIEVYLDAEIQAVDGFVGNFSTTISINGEEKLLEHGVAILATGAQELKPQVHLYGQDPRVLTALELDKKLIDGELSLDGISSVVFIQCVGSRIAERPYCSRVCCTHSIKNALNLKAMKKNLRVFVVYRDMRPYGLREQLYRQAREQGIRFIRYEHDLGLEVGRRNGNLRIAFTDYVLQSKMEVSADLLVLASAIVSPRDERLAQFFKVPLNEDGFLSEAHAKLRPVDFATDGVFLCGLAHYPKPIDETIAQAQAAASRAITLLAKKTVQLAGTVANVDTAMCSSCGVCVAICPYSAPSFDEKTGKAIINPALCKGCGLCVASCRSGAIGLKGFDNSQIFAQIEAM